MPFPFSCFAVLELCSRLFLITLFYFQALCSVFKHCEHYHMLVMLFKRRNYSFCVCVCVCAQLTVNAIDNGFPSRTTPCQKTVQVNVDQDSLAFEFPDYTRSVSENVNVGYSVLDLNTQPNVSPCETELHCMSLYKINSCKIPSSQF